MKPNVLVVMGEGINCEQETALAFERAGASAKKVHVNDWIAGKEKLEDYHILVVPGGFAFGDELGAGKAFANKVLNAKVNGKTMQESLGEFVGQGKLIAGICNGFQILAKMGLLPALDGNYFTQQVSLFKNASGKFENRWVRLKFNPKSPCVFTKGLKEMELVVRHGEGQLLADSPGTLARLKKQNQVAAWYADDRGKPTMKYPWNPNGATEGIAGICDETGRVFGLMPHPEAHQWPALHPQYLRTGKEGKNEEGQGLKMFENAIEYVKRKF